MFSTNDRRWGRRRGPWGWRRTVLNRRLRSNRRLRYRVRLRRHRTLVSKACGHRDPVPLGIHALCVSVVVAPLHGISALIACRGTTDRSHQQTHTGTRCRTLTAAADRGAGSRANRSTHHRAFDCTVFLHLGRRRARAFHCVLPAHRVIGTKLIKILARSRQCHVAGPGWNAGTSRYSQCQQAQQVTRSTTSRHDL